MMEVRLKKRLLAAGGEMMLDIDFHIGKGDFVSLYGPSGAGKTSILRMIAGLLQPEEGRILVNNELWLDTTANISLKSRKRKIGLVFQDYALFPHMTVRENLEFALEDNRDISIVDELISMVELEQLQNRKPSTLSGGQQQRVGLARALVRRPEVLMLDEPLSALDAGIRGRLQDYILRVHREYDLTTILVSHDIAEVIKLSDRIFIMEKGKFVRSGRPLEVFFDSHISGKFQFTGEILDISKEDVVYIATILIGNDIVRVVAEENELSGLGKGDTVGVISKAFNPILKKIENKK